MVMKITVLLLFYACMVGALKECCNDTLNVLIEEQCFNNSGPINLECEQKYLVELNNVTSATIEDEYLVIDDYFGNRTLPGTEFCVSKLYENDSDVALVCLEKDSNESDYKNDSKVTKKENAKVIDDLDAASWYLMAVCSLISVFFLILTFLTYLLVPSLRDLEGKCILNFTGASTVAYFVLSILLFIPSPVPNCPIFSFTIYTSLLIAHFWLNALSFQIWRSTINFYVKMINSKSQWYFAYCLYGYGVPIILLVTTLIERYVAELKKCWLIGNKAAWMYFYGPIVLLMTINTFLHVWTAKILWIDFNKNTVTAAIKRLRYKYLIYVSLFLIMAICWVHEIMSFTLDKEENVMNAIIWHAVDCKNALQGVLIFTLLVYIRKRALIELAKRKLCCFSLPIQWTMLQDEED